MGTCYFVRLKPESPSIDGAMDGRALALNDGSLSTRCEVLGVPSVSSFLSPDPTMMRDIMDSAGMRDVPVPPEPWFAPEAGLETLRKLIPLVESEREWFSHPEALIADLRRMQEILIQAEAAGAEWNLDVDF